MLIACRGCKRHVRRHAARCPFCAAAIATFAALVATTTPVVAEPEERMVHPLYGLPPPPVPKTRNAIQADLGLGVVGLAYERALNDRVTVALSGHVFGTWWGPTFDLPNFTGFGGQLRPSFFLADDAPRGVYISPYFRAESVAAEGRRGGGWSLGTFIGYSFVIGHHLNIRVGAGAQYMSYSAGDAEWKRFHPALDLVVGYGF